MSLLSLRQTFNSLHSRNEVQNAHGNPYDINDSGRYKTTHINMQQTNCNKSTNTKRSIESQMIQGIQK